MAMKNLLTLVRRSQKHLARNQPVRSFSSTVASDSAPIFTFPAIPSPPPPILSEILKSKKLKPDPRILKIVSLHPTRFSYSSVLETRITTRFPNGLRVVSKSNISAKTATVGVWIHRGFLSDETKEAYYSRKCFSSAIKNDQHTIKNDQHPIKNFNVSSINLGDKDLTIMIFAINMENLLLRVARTFPKVANFYMPLAMYIDHVKLATVEVSTFQKIGYGTKMML